LKCSVGIQRKSGSGFQPLRRGKMPRPLFEAEPRNLADIVSHGVAFEGFEGFEGCWQLRLCLMPEKWWRLESLLSSGWKLPPPWGAALCKGHTRSTKPSQRRNPCRIVLKVLFL